MSVAWCRVLPWRHSVDRLPASDGYWCTRCGSRSASVQLKGAKQQAIEALVRAHLHAATLDIAERTAADLRQQLRRHLDALSGTPRQDNPWKDGRR